MKRAAAALILGVAIGAAGCASSTSGQGGGQPPPPRQTPLTDLTPTVEGTVAILEAAFARQGIRLSVPTVAHQPGEPAGIAQAPRVLLQADVHDPEAGWILIYAFRDTDTAAARGREFADYLKSGFGQTNYPNDARFSLTQLGETVLFTWYSPGRVADPVASQAAFEAVASVGITIPVER